MSVQNVAVFGATGNVGAEVVHILSKQANIKIRVVTKRPDHDALKNDEGKTTSNIHIWEGDYCSDKGKIVEAMSNCSRVFVALPQSLSSKDMVTSGKFLADCAAEAGVKYLVRLSSLGIDKHSSKFVQSQGPLGDAHVEVENYCREVLKLHVISVRPTSFFTNLNFNVQEIKDERKMSTPSGHSARVNWVSPADIAAVVAAVLSSETGPANCTQNLSVLDVTGPKENTLSAPRVAALITKHLQSSSNGEETVTYVEADVPQYPDYAGLWNFLRAGGFDLNTDTVSQLCSTEGATLQEYIQTTFQF